MLTCHEIFGFMPATLAVGILDATFQADKPTYRTALSAVAGARKVRPEFFLKKPKTERHPAMLAVLAAPRMEETAALLLRQWLTISQPAMLVDFLNRLGIPHRDGIVDQFPAAVEAAALRAAVEDLLAKYPEKHVAVYLHCLLAMKLVDWPNLRALMQQDQRLQLG